MTDCNCHACIKKFNKGDVKMIKIEEIKSQIKGAEQYLAMLEEQLAEMEQTKPELKVGDWVDNIEHNYPRIILSITHDHIITKPMGVQKGSLLSYKSCIKNVTRNLTARSVINWLTWKELQSLNLHERTRITYQTPTGCVHTAALRDLTSAHKRYAIMDHL